MHFKTDFCIILTVLTEHAFSFSPEKGSVRLKRGEVHSFTGNLEFLQCVSRPPLVISSQIHDYIGSQPHAFQEIDVQ